MSHEELLKKACQQSKRIDELSDHLFLRKSTAVRLKIRRELLKEKLSKYASTGDMKAVAHKLVVAANDGKLKKKQVLSDMLQTVAHNLHRQPKGRRYNKSVQEFYEVLLILGGPRLARFVAENLDGPGINTMYHWRQMNSLKLKTHVCESNMLQFIELYKNCKQKHGINHRVPVLTAEDETAIKAVVSYAQESDGTHNCLLDKRIEIGDNENSYNGLDYARVILLNPLHLSFPRVVLWLTPTCNRFTHADVERQWKIILKAYKKELESILGPLIGQSSDGDARRCKLQLQNMLYDETEKFQPIPSNLGFIMSVKKENTVDGKYVIRNVGDQDAIHNHKKRINPLDHASRVITMGEGFIVHMNHLVLVSEQFPRLSHGLTKTHLERKDRQNWQVAQEITFLRVQVCLKKIILGDDGKPPNPTVTGTLVYLEVVWHYVEIFFSPTASLVDRIKYAGFVVHYLGIWRNFLFNHKDRQLKIHFITRECYQHVLISCHFAVILICYMRDCFPDVECRLDLTGSDVCESFFSLNGQWIGIRHNYTFNEMRCKINESYGEAELHHVRFRWTSTVSSP